MCCFERRALAWCVALLLVIGTVPARATEAQQQRARAVYVIGEAAFKRGEFQEARDRFREAYLLAPIPEILYNMASAEEALGHPGEAADRLRAYLRSVGHTDERPTIERRVRGLEEAQRLVDLEALRRDGPKLLAVPANDPRAERRRRLAIGLSLGGVILVGAGVGLGLGLGLQPQHTDSTLHTQQATP